MFIPLTRDFFQHAMLVSRIWKVIKSKIPGSYKINHDPFLHQNYLLPKNIFVGSIFGGHFILRSK